MPDEQTESTPREMCMGLRRWSHGPRHHDRTVKERGRRQLGLRPKLLAIEPLEVRALLTGASLASPDLAAGWHNPFAPLDVNGDSIVSPIDALVVINDLNVAGPRALGKFPTPS